MPTALTLWLLATGRWGSYIGNEALGLFVTEVALAVAVVALLVARARGAVDLEVLRRPGVPVALAAAVFAVALTRFVWSEALTRDALRDFAPYGYAAVAILTLLTPLMRWERSSGVVFATLAVHATWVAVSDNVPSAVVGLPLLGGAPVFASRPDFDATVCGVGVAVCAYWLRHHRSGRFATAAVLVLGVAQTALVLSLPSRAGLLAAIVSLGLVWLARTRRSPRGSWRRVTAQVALVVVGVPLVLLALSQTSPGKRFVDTVQDRGTAAGTTNARQLAWESVAEYVTDEPTRALFGVGFGPDFMHDSGADDYFEGELYRGVRSPHNYLVGTSARLGIPGALLLLAVIVAGLVASWRLLRTRGDLAVLDVLAVAVTAGVPVAAAFGVILESPFGAVPYFWAIGHVARIARINPAAGDGTHSVPGAKRARRSTIDAHQTTG